MWLLTPQNYEKVRRLFPPGSRRLAVLRGAVLVLPMPIWFVYPMLLLTLWQVGDPRLWPAVLVPACAFLTCTVLRRWLDLPRPYEQPGFEPLVPRPDGRPGQSCPSRHVTSAFVIALVTGSINPGLGLPLLACAVLIGLCRVLAGVHHPRDVYAGAALALVFTVLGLWLF